MKLASICSLMLALVLISATARAQTAEPAKEKPKFELLDGDRVVLLGGTLIEREQKYGWWELMLTCAYPDRHIVFRNLGWSGDTVWGESRAGFDPPAKGYENLLAQVAAVKPTVIILGYGNVEAHAGAADLPRFIKQYEKLLDVLKTVSAPGVRFLIISPMLMEKMDPPLPDPAEYNAKVMEYRRAIKEMADKQELSFVACNVPSTTTDGLQFSGDDYRKTTSAFSSLLGHSSNGIEVIAPLRTLITRKNFLYFNAYRPQNDTYLFGFRKKEQGNNAGEVQELLKLVDELDREITKLKKPKPHTYELIRIGDAKDADKKVEAKK